MLAILRQDARNENIYFPFWWGYNWGKWGCAGADWPAAVSYTPLDVSKRQILTCGEVKKLLARCAKEEGLTGREKAIVRELREENEKLAVIPPEEYGDFARLKAEAASVWAKAKANSDFSAFAPTLRKIVDYSKKFASYRAKKGQNLYDVLLDCLLYTSRCV